MFKVGDIVRIEGDNDVWDGTVATIEVVDAVGHPEFPYSILVISSPRPFTEGERYWWTGETLVAHEGPRAKLDRIIKETFPHRLDVYYSTLTGGAVVFAEDGKLYRLTASGDIESEADRKPSRRVTKNA